MMAQRPVKDVHVGDTVIWHDSTGGAHKALVTAVCHQIVLM